MAQILRPPIRLSQNEIDYILANERAKWRNFRIQQVRAQSREEAFRIREAGRKEEENQKERIKKNENAKWEAEKQKKLDKLEKKLQNDLQDIGKAHESAQIENEALQAFNNRRKNDNIVAAKRGRKALLTLDKEKSLASETHYATRLTKKRVMQKEKKRAARISKLPTPVKIKARKKTNIKPPKKVMFHEAGTFTTSSYVPSKVKIISGKESAERENEKYEEMKALKMQEEEEKRKKIEERGKLAMKREKTKEMYSNLMNQLNEAEENQELSDYLKGDENIDSLGIENYLRREREADAAAAEEKVKKLLSEDLDTIPIKLVTDSSKEETESSMEKFFNINVETSNSDKSVSVQDEVDNIQSQVKSPLLQSKDIHFDNIQSQVKSPLLQSKDIHFKETVPVHKIPIIREKFLVRVPLSDQSESITPHSTEKSETSPESCKGESSFEEHKIKSKVRSSSEGSFKETLSIGEKTESDAATSYQNLPQKENKNLISKGKPHSKVRISPSSTSSGITSYLEPPPTVTGSELNNDLWKNLKDIKERNRRLESILTKLQKEEAKSSSTSTTDSKENLSSFKTPPKIYTETLKDEGLGVKPVTKREKFEYNKKKVLEIYMRRLLQMKRDELKEISASTVEGSGISVNSSDSNLLELLQVMNLSSSDSTLSTTPTITSDLLNRLSKISFSPSDISTPIPSTLNTVASDHKVPSLQTSSFSPLQTDNSEHASQSMIGIDMKKQILLRLVELQKLKQECIRKTKLALLNQNTSAEENQKSTQGSRSQNEIVSEASGSSLGWGSNNYETPPREISTQSWSEFSDFPFQRQQQQQQRDATDSVLKERIHKEPLGFGEYDDSVESCLDLSKIQSGSYHENFNQYVSLEKEIKALEESARKLKATMEPDKISIGEKSQVSHVPVSQRDASSSSFSSLPDMDQIIRRIGLGWAHSMATKMDKAEEVRSSDCTE
ncbi:Centrosomal protein [Armadillidium vulgare]|nr:Centrosomal protein [Armadillidium vulgare]